MIEHQENSLSNHYTECWQLVPDGDQFFTAASWILNGGASAGLELALAAIVQQELSA